MSMPNIPDFTPNITLTLDDSLVMLLASIAQEEIALAHLINAEAEKLQFALGTLATSSEAPLPFEDVLRANASALQMMNAVTLKEVLLQMKLGHVVRLFEERPLPVASS